MLVFSVALLLLLTEEVFAAFRIDPQSSSNEHIKNLYDDLLSNYNRLIRPVANITDTLTVHMDLKLTQLIEVNLRNQLMTTNVWVEQRWIDYKLQWNPEDYGGVEELHVPTELIWLPDIVLYNNADGNYEMIMLTKATLRYNGQVTWIPPANFKSYCEIDVRWFPFDEQSCTMKFGSWTYDGLQVDLRHIRQEEGTDFVPEAIDLKEFYLSVEWDILAVPARRNEEFYPCCKEPYPDITFTVTIRRKTLFYTVNLIIPCVGISFLTVVVFYLPCNSGEKVQLCISILLALTVFFILLAEIIPPTSLAIPLLGQYLLFTMLLVTVSICVTVCVLNVHFRRPSFHKMSLWVRKIFIDILPHILMIARTDSRKKRSRILRSCRMDADSGNGCSGKMDALKKMGDPGDIRTELYEQRLYPPEIMRAIDGVQYIAQHIKNEDKDKEFVEDWKYVAMVLDRLFLWLFTIACVLGTALIIMSAPSLYDSREPIDARRSEIGHFHRKAASVL